MRRVSAVFVVVGAFLLAGPAYGQKSPTAKIKRHVFLAQENLDLGETRAARDQLLAAIAVAEESELAKDLLNARTHLFLAAIYVNELGDEASAIEHFKAALTIAPGIQLEAPHDTEAAKVAFSRAERALSPTGECETLRGIRHTPVTRAEAGVATEIGCQAEGILLPGSAQISYQVDEEDSYASTDMKRKGPCSWVGSIPAEAVRGETINYYITIRSKEGRVFAMRGNPKAPYKLIVEQTEKSPPPPEFRQRDEVPDELRLLGRPKQPKNGGCAGCSGSRAPGAGDLGVLAFGLLVLAVALRRRRRPRPDAGPARRP